MNTGTKISGLLHVGLILWMMLGGLFGPPERSRPVPVAEVSLVTAEEFAALSQPPARQPEPAAPAPAPEISAPEPLPEVEPEPEPAPTPEEPAVPPPTAEMPGPLTQPDASPRPLPRDIDRVAPVAAPETEAQPGPVETPAVTPEPALEPEQAEPEREATAPEAATTEIVTEATETTDSPEPQRLTTAPEVSQRPRVRPAAPPRPETPPRAEAPTPEPQPRAPAQDAIADALAEALAADPAPRAPSGPPLTGGERDALRLAVQECWNVGALSTDALNVTVVVGLSMSRDARPEAASIRLISSDGGSGAAVAQAFEAARRAIIRCGANGYGLPVDKYDHWREIEMTFNPEGMRLR